MIQNDVIDTAKWEGRIEGKAEGKAEGIAEGKAEGLAEGKAVGLAEGMRQVAARMKDTGVDVATIAKCTGLSEEIILSAIALPLLPFRPDSQQRFWETVQ